MRYKEVQKRDVLETSDKEANGEDDVDKEKSLVCSIAEPVHRSWKNQDHQAGCLSWSVF
jgi:hypothetical protein